MTAVVGNMGDMSELQEDPIFEVLLATLKAKSDVRNLIITGNKDDRASKRPANASQTPEYVGGMQQTFTALNKFGKPFELIAGENEWKAFLLEEAEYTCAILESTVKSLPRNGKLIFTAKVKAVGRDLFIYLDTNMFASNGRNNCYPLPIEEMRHLQEVLLLKLIQSNLKKMEFSRIIFVGHHPLCVFPYEKNMPYQVETNLIQLFSTLLLSWESAPVVLYLCSHYSVYQHQVIELNGYEINMHIVGTGGSPMSESPLSGGRQKHKKSTPKRRSKDVAASAVSAATDSVEYNKAAGEIYIGSLFFSAHLETIIHEHGYLFLPAVSDRVEFRPLFLVDVGGRTRQRSRKRRTTRSIRLF